MGSCLPPVPLRAVRGRLDGSFSPARALKERAELPGRAELMRGTATRTERSARNRDRDRAERTAAPPQSGGHSLGSAPEAPPEHSRLWTRL